MKELVIKCPFCHKEQTLKMTEEDFDKYMKLKDKTSIQNIFPNWSADDRELLITGICKKCWDDTFADNKEGE